ncbi:NAD(P)-binding domain-containing protein [Nocardia abscessus]|uniref:NAD(P)-binding domain-containing protein n=1 Tax=Nocardia abscessus TaxID=120957 RepID=UPI002456E524|nr:NAD(P)-binding domain-containing protein [Nocardia abscessus]
MRVLISGYGIISAGIVHNLLKAHDAEICIVSRHLDSYSDSRVRILDAVAHVSGSPEVVVGCFESVETAENFWYSAAMTSIIENDRPVCIDISTLGVDYFSEWHLRLELLGADRIECPVTGSRAGSLDGTLSLFAYFSAGRPTPIVDRILSLISCRIYLFEQPCGPTRFKLIYNAWGATILHSLCNFLPDLQTHLSETDFETACTIVKSDGWMAPVAASKLEIIRSRAFEDIHFSLENMVKDLNLYQAMCGGRTGALFTAVKDVYGQAADRHNYRVDYTKVADECVMVPRD